MALQYFARVGHRADSSSDSLPFRQNDGAFRPSRDEVFASLDGRDLTIRGNRWRVEVFSVREIGGRRYAQMALRGAPDYFVTVRTLPDVDTRRIVPGLLLWLMRPSTAATTIDIG